MKRLRNYVVTDGGKIIAPDIFADPDGSYWFIAKYAVDCDGSGGNPDNDPYFQDDTSYHYNGKALNAYEVPFIVLPPDIISAVTPIVLGSKASATLVSTGVSMIALVGDIGPKHKLGEGSPFLASGIGLNPNPNYGGTSDYNAVLWRFWPGKQVTIAGVTYPLQAS